jgi:anti-sigma factor RsiW
MMDHQQALQLLPAYVDHELSPTETLLLEQHLSGCESCRHEYEGQQAVSSLIRAANLRRNAPEDLAQAIRAALPVHAVHAAKDKARPRRRPAPSFRPNIAAWLPAGMLTFGTLAMAAAAALYLLLPSPGQRVAGELVDSHVRSLQMDHATDVTSTDRHTVKPWFNGRLDFAPPVIDLAAQGYPLIGGRLDYLDGRTVAVLVYRYRLHPIDLYMWPNDATGTGTAPADAVLKGYRIAHWHMAGMSCWAITDAGEAELDGFVRALRAQAGS